jgi:hypothetical protein
MVTEPTGLSVISPVNQVTSMSLVTLTVLVSPLFCLEMAPKDKSSDTGISLL